MAGKHSRSKASSTPARKTKTRGQSRKAEQDVVPDIYHDMLAEAVSSSSNQFGDDTRAVKRRKVGPKVVIETRERAPEDDVPPLDTVPEASSPNLSTNGSTHGGLSNQQTAYNDSGDSEESEVEWEEVDIGGQGSTAAAAPQDEHEGQSLDIVMQDNESLSKKPVRLKRKPITAEEKKLRLEVHKAHLLCLIAHVEVRNQMCNDTGTQAVLKPLVPKKMRSYLNPAHDLSQFQRTRSFMDGLSQAKALWRVKFRVTASGLRKANWAENEAALKEFKLPEDIDSPIDQIEFCNLARKLEGSRDVGIQLFCSLLRSVGVTARLVCSLQPLPFASTTKSTDTAKSIHDYILAESDAHDMTSEIEAAEVSSHQPLAGPKRARRIGQPGFGNSSKIDLGRPPPLKTPPRKRIKDSPYPVYWVEAFNTAQQKWVPVDPLVTDTVSKPSKFEPPASDAGNSMSYVLAFEEDSSARDVTRRYARSYNAKTRRNRVEATKDGERWWKKTMRALRRGWDLDRDQVEDAELAAKEAAEEMPRNVQDFKDHPYYVLERHLRRNEVIHPRREVGKVSASRSLTSGEGKSLEPIFRRRDVNVVKSGDGWYRLGREIKTGEQPLKMVRPRTKRGRSLGENDQGHSDDGEQNEIGMYAEFQTILYVPPPVVRGKVPKNAFGNLDIYAPNMVPMGGVHVAHQEAAKAARILGLDYADAVTGFEFRGRHGTAVMKGVVVAEEYREAIEAVIERFEDDRAQAEEQRRTLEALRMWKRFMAGVRIRERIAGYEIEGEQGEIEKGMDEAEEQKEEEDDEGGGFFPDRDQEAIAEPTIERFRSRAYTPESPSMGGGFLADEIDPSVYMKPSAVESSPMDGQVQASPIQQDFNAPRLPSRLSPDDDPIASTASELDHTGGGGFMVEDDDEEPPNVAEVGAAETVRATSDTNNSQDHDPPNVATDSEIVHPVAGTDRSEESKGLDDLMEHDRIDEAPLSPVGQTGIQDPTPVLSDTDSIDRGSLLSEDPDDEDADPEWLAGS